MTSVVGAPLAMPASIAGEPVRSVRSVALVNSCASVATNDVASVPVRVRHAARFITVPATENRPTTALCSD